MRGFVLLASVVLISACGDARSPVEPATEKPTAVMFALGTEVIKLSSGEVLSSTTQHWQGQMRGQKVWSSPYSSASLSAMQSISMPDSIVQKMVTTYGFSTGADPALITITAPNYVAAGVDTGTVVQAGVTWRVIRSWGSGWGLVNWHSILKNGVMVFKTRNVWEPSGIGYRLKQVISEDYTQPGGILVRITSTMTNSGVTVLTHQMGASLPRASLLTTGRAVAVKAAQTCVDWLLPTPLSATTLSPCSDAVISYAFTLGRVILAGAAAIAVTPASPILFGALVLETAELSYRQFGWMHHCFGAGRSPKQKR